MEQVPLCSIRKIIIIKSMFAEQDFAWPYSAEIQTIWQCPACAHVCQMPNWFYGAEHEKAD